MKKKDTSRIRVQVMWNRLISVVEEQAQTLIRAAFSTTVREAGDLSAGVFDVKGRMLAQAVTGTPGHVNSMAASVQHFLKVFPAHTMSEGDSFITNDPWLTSGHLHDFTVVTPSFLDGELVGFVAETIHVVDVGGRGMGPDARQVYEEGLYIPIMRIAEKGRMNEDLLRILRANVREAVQVEGDLFSMVASCDDGARRLAQMMREFDMTSLDDLAEHIIESSHAATLAEIRKLKPGVYRNSMTCDGYDGEVTIVAALTITKNGIHVDYTGSSPMSRFGINVVANYTAAYTCFGVKCMLTPDIPNNFGSMLPITVSAPEGCILNVQRPAPVAARHIVGHMLPDVVLGCLHQAVKGGAPAEGSMMWNPQLRGSRWFDGETRVWESFMFKNGGTGARPQSDGMSVTAFPAGVKLVPVEAAEAVSPLTIWRKEFRPNSGGAGKFRGGLGQILEIGSAVGETMNIQAMFDRVHHPARGRDGGQSGAGGLVQLVSGKPIKPKGFQEIPAGDRLHLELPGGGGFGNPFERDPARVVSDVVNQLISRESARRDYGVVVTASGKLDEKATASLRSGKGKMKRKRAG
jgi:N-methylhydantoinase B